MSEGELEKKAVEKIESAVDELSHALLQLQYIKSRCANDSKKLSLVSYIIEVLNIAGELLITSEYAIKALEEKK